MKKDTRNEVKMNDFNHSTSQQFNNLASQPLNPSTSDGIAIRVDHVSKKFCRYLKKSMLYGVQDISRNLLGMSTKPDRLRKAEFWAVNDISFELKKGECLGIIGPNGSGKSTILKMLNGIFMPDKGKIEINGSMGALIELGAGFHPMLTGRENIHVNAAILGMSKEWVDENFDDIIAFAGIGDFLDTPVKNYSSGMFVRLGFAIAAHCEPDILLIDEVLAVGDEAFRRKCLQKIIDIKTSDRAIVFISHSMFSVKQICDRVILLNSGKEVISGPPEKVVDKYEKLALNNNDKKDNPKTFLKYSYLGGQIYFKGDDEVHISEPILLDSKNENKRIFNSNDQLKIQFNYLVKKQYHAPFLFIRLLRTDGVNVWYQTFRDYKIKTGKNVQVEIPIRNLQLVPGKYLLSVRMGDVVKGIGCADPIEFTVMNPNEILGYDGVPNYSIYYPAISKIKELN